MNRAPLLRYALIGILISSIVGGGIYRIWHRSSEKIRPVSCQSPLQICQFIIKGQPVQIQFGQPPSGLRPFLLTVMTAKAHRVYVTFTMRDMDMGYNRYRLTRTNAGIWQAKVILPVCVTGRHDWLVTINIDGNLISIPFSSN